MTDITVTEITATEITVTEITVTEITVPGRAESLSFDCREIQSQVTPRLRATRNSELLGKKISPS